MGSSWIQHNFNTISIQKCIVIKPLLMIRDDHQYSEGEWRPSISKTTEHWNTKVINIWTKLVTFSTNQDSGIGDFPGNISLLHTYPVLLGGLLHCEGSLLHIHASTCQTGCQSPQGGLGNLSCIWPLFKMEDFLKTASVWFLLTFLSW